MSGRSLAPTKWRTAGQHSGAPDGQQRLLARLGVG